MTKAFKDLRLLSTVVDKLDIERWSYAKVIEDAKPLQNTRNKRAIQSRAKRSFQN